ncbi:MAG TPA: TonB-dependent receptor [Gemmatimonadales bacterium]|nr:TonB-dependent receptor [Gemmatimonadales bacterium]
MRRSLLLVGALVCAGGRLVAQVDTTAKPKPKVGADTTQGPADTTAKRDTTPPDTIEHFLPGFAPAVPAGPLPRGERWRFTVDSLVMSNITTLGDLLAHIPGVYVVRGGWFGAPEIAVYGGQGPLGLEVYWDGVPYLPVGRDSVWLDPARIPLAPLERIDVLVLPATLRVYLVSLQAHSTIPRTQVRISTGQASIAQYRGGFAKRWGSGVGMSLSADYRNINGFEGSSTTGFNDVDLWLKLEYERSPHFGVSVQTLSSTWNRSGATGLVDSWKQRRLDQLFQAFAASRDDGLGPRATLTLARAQVTGDTVVSDRSRYQGQLEISETRSRATVGVVARLSGATGPFLVDAYAAWHPLSFVTLSADARRSYYGAKGHGNRAHVAGSLALPLGFSVRGEASRVEDFNVPIDPADSFQMANDYAAYLRWDTKKITLEAGQVRRDPYRPVGFAAGIRPVAFLGATPQSTYLSVFVGLRPLSGVQVSGWYFDPRTGGGDFEPPTHARISATFFSKFWRVYRSGAFSLRGEYAIESWSRGLGGRDSSGAQIPLGPATFAETNIQLRIGDFTGYWMTRNYNGMRGSYVTGLGYPKRVQYYGVQWFFNN